MYPNYSLQFDFRITKFQFHIDIGYFSSLKEERPGVRHYCNHSEVLLPSKSPDHMWLYCRLQVPEKTNIRKIRENDLKRKILNYVIDFKKKNFL